MALKKVKKQKKTRRSQTEFPGLDPKCNRGNLRDKIDFDYVDKLNDKEKAFLDKFSTEYYSADFRPTKTMKRQLHKSKREKRKIYKMNNDRNVDTTSYLGNYGALESYESLNENSRISESPETALLEMIDLKRKKKL